MRWEPVVEHYTAERIPNPNPDGQHPWQVHYTVWNAVVRVCLRHGRVGPFHERPITDHPDPLSADAIDEWPLGNEPGDCDYWMIDDWWNGERYVYLEIPSPAAFTESWLRDLVDALGEYPGWGVGIMAFPEAYILAFADKLMVTGKIFADCRNLSCVVTQGQMELMGRASERSP